MNIGINLLPYKEISGTEVYIQTLLRYLVDLDRKDSFYIFVSKNTPLRKLDNHENVYYIQTSVDPHNRIKRVLWEQTIFRSCLKKYSVDILFNPTVSGPRFSSIKELVTLHDCAYERFKEFDSLFTKLYFKFMFHAITKEKNTIITVSNYSKKEIIKLYGVKQKKIHVVYEGLSNELCIYFLPEYKKENILRKFNINRPYFFYIGLRRPRKNIINLLKAFKLFGALNRDVLIVLAGRLDNRFINVDEIADQLGIKEKVIQTGFISDIEKYILYKESIALTFVSLYEGFGIPIIEAQALGVPVLASGTSAIPEIGGDGALYINPYSPSDICKGMQKIYEDKKYRKHLISLGLENAKRFSTSKEAHQILHLLRNP